VLLWLRRIWGPLAASWTLLAVSCGPPSSLESALVSQGIDGCYRLSEGSWRTDSLANSFYSMSLVPKEIRLLPSRLVSRNWDYLQSDSMPLLAVESSDTGPARYFPFTYWQRKHPGSDSIYVGEVLPMAGTRLDLVREGPNLRGLLTAFTDSPMPNSTDHASFHISLQRIQCW
jgi:hypothetical protein